MTSRSRLRRLATAACAVLVTAGAALVAGAPASAADTADEVHYTFTGPASVTFDWRGSATTIEYGPDATYGSTVTSVPASPVPFSSAGPFREAALTGLAPGTTYHYSIGGGPDATFSTAPTGDYTAAAVGDLVDSGTEAWVTGLHQLIAAQSPAFVLGLGDLTYANEHCQPAVDRHFNDVMAWSRTAAYVPVWGNHEYGKVNAESLPCAVNDDFRNYKGRFALPNPRTLSINTATKASAPGCPLVNGTNPCRGEDWGWFDAGPVRWITGPETWPGMVAEWRAAVAPIMAAAQNDPRITTIVTAGHRPAYSSRADQVNADYKAAVDALGATYPKYKLHLNGHTHALEAFSAQRGVVHVTAGGGGAVPVQPAAPAAGSVFFSRHPGFARVDVRSGAVSVRIVCGPDNGRGTDPCTPGATIWGPVQVSGPPPANQPPTAVVGTPSCSGLTCTFSGAGSSDPDGTIASYAWTFGDGTTGTGATPSHTYAAGGSYTVTLKVTDDRGGTATATRTVTVTPAAGGISFVGVRSSNATVTTATVTVPAGVAAGDGLLLAESVASTTVAVGPPTGAGTWTLVATRDAGSMVTRFYARTAQAGDAGRTVSVTLDAFAKVDLQLAAYRGTAASGPVAAVATAADTVSTAAHATPVATVADERSWVVSYWADKSTSTTAWTPPAGVAVRDVVLGSGSGYLTSLLADSAGPVPAGTYGGLVARTDAPATKAVMATIVLAAA